MAYYRNDTTGKVQFHPKSGIGASLGSTEIAEDGKPVKPRTTLAPSADEIKRAKALLKDNRLTPIERRAAQEIVAADEKVAARRASASAKKAERDAKASSKTTGNSAGDSTQEGDQ
jgi:hypothetical protein